MMVRQINAAALDAIAKTRGLESIILVRVFWTDSDIITYSDREHLDVGVVGGILEVSNLDSVFNTLTGSASQNVTIKLNDTDGHIKQIFNNVDIHKRPVQILQWFDGLPLSESFIIYEGMINSPIEWVEHERTLSFEVITQLEDVLTGFSVEDGDFIDVPQDFIGKAWPMPFGTVVNVPALRLDDIVTGALANDTGVPDPYLGAQAGYSDCQSGKQLAIAACLSSVGAKLQFEGDLGGAGLAVFNKGVQYQQRAQDMIRQVAQQSNRASQTYNGVKRDLEIRFDSSHLTILNGSKFLQNIPVGVKIGQAHFFGVFNGDDFSVISKRGPYPWETNQSGDSSAGSGGSDPVNIEYDKIDFLERGLFDLGTTDDLGADDFVTPTDQDKIEDPCGPHNLILPGGCNKGDSNRGAQNSQTYHGLLYIPAGSPVKPDTNYPIRYILSIIPGTLVLGVAAERSFVNRSAGTLSKTLVGVPGDYFTISEQTFGSITALVLTLKQPLSSIEDIPFRTTPGAHASIDWSDEIYVTLQSPVGPNTVDIIQYIINRWAPHFAIDTASFNHVRTKVANYPSNFCLFDRKELFTILKEIAYQARCAVFLKNNTFYIKYLPEEDDPVETITETDVVWQSVQVGCTRTEDISTRITGTWKENYFQKLPHKIVLMNNLAKYGLHEKSIDFYIYTDFLCVQKSLAFITMRESNVWKTLKLKTFITKLKIESLDTVTFDFSRDWIANGPVNGLIQKCNFDSDKLEIDLEVQLPILLGTITTYVNYHPSEADINPIQEETAGSITENRQAGGLFGAPHNVTYNLIRTDHGKALVTNDLNDSNIPITTTGNMPKKSPPGTRAFSIKEVDATKLGTNYEVPLKIVNQAEYKQAAQDRASKIERPKITSTTQILPGKVTGKNGADPDIANATQFSVIIYEGGEIDDKPTDANATILEFDSNDDIEPGTIVTILRVLSVKPSATLGSPPDIKVKNYIQETTWQPDKTM